MERGRTIESRYDALFQGCAPRSRKTLRADSNIISLMLYAKQRDISEETYSHNDTTFIAVKRELNKRLNEVNRSCVQD